jgi:hypothetical protein
MTERTSVQMAREEIQKTLAFWENWREPLPAADCQMVDHLVGSQIMLLRAIEEVAGTPQGKRPPPDRSDLRLGSGGKDHD